MFENNTHYCKINRIIYHFFFYLNIILYPDLAKICSLVDQRCTPNRWSLSTLSGLGSVIPSLTLAAFILDPIRAQRYRPSNCLLTDLRLFANWSLRRNVISPEEEIIVIETLLDIFLHYWFCDMEVSRHFKRYYWRFYEVIGFTYIMWKCMKILLINACEPRDAILTFYVIYRLRRMSLTIIIKIIYLTTIFHVFYIYIQKIILSYFN